VCHPFLFLKKYRSGLFYTTYLRQNEPLAKAQKSSFFCLKLKKNVLDIKDKSIKFLQNFHHSFGVG